MGPARRGLSLAAALALCWAAAVRAAPEQRLDGVVTRISDGDTLWLRPDGGRRPVKLRLVGLDAPELCQPHGPEARAALAAQAEGRRASMRRHATDDYGRPLATLWIDGRDVGAALVRDGHAWSARWRDDPGPYAREERAARAARRGLFAQAAPEPPREFRRRHGPCP